MTETPVTHYVPSSEAERQWLEAYDASKYPLVAVTTDVVLFTIRSGRLCVLLVQRKDYPYKGAWALPGGFIRPEETGEVSALRELGEESSILVSAAHIEQLATYTDPQRDPRMRVVSVAYVGLVPNMPLPVGGDDAADAYWWVVDDLTLDDDQEASEDSPAIAFDHKRIIRDGLERVRGKLEYTPLAMRFLDDRFTLADLRRVYEAVWGVELHAANFRRKVLNTPGFVIPTDDQGPSQFDGGRAAALYSAGQAAILHPAMLRA